MRSLAMIVCSLFVLSTVFPIVASVAPFDRAPQWLGVADVSVAVTLVASVFVLIGRHGAVTGPRTAEMSVRGYRRASHLALALLVMFFVVPSGRIDWTILLVGLAWRFWLLSCVLPVLVSSFQDEGTVPRVPSSI
jgi:hypothetical protein